MERWELARPALHKHRNHRRRLRLMRRPFGKQIERLPIQQRLGRLGEQAILLINRVQRYAGSGPNHVHHAT